MRIRLKKGVALIGAIAGAAIATALILYNVNTGNSLNTSDMEGSGILEGIESAFEGNSPETGAAQQPAVVADAQGVDAAVAAGALGTAFGDKQEEQSGQSGQNEQSEQKDTPAAPTGNTGDTAANEAPAQSQGASGQSASESAEAAPVQEQAQQTQTVQTYVEAVPQTRTETVVSEKVVTVETPVTVTEVVPVEVEVVPVDFYGKSEAAAEAQLTTSLREEEAKKAQAADMLRLEAAAGTEQNRDYITGDDVSGDSFVIFY